LAQERNLKSLQITPYNHALHNPQPYLPHFTKFSRTPYIRTRISCSMSYSKALAITAFGIGAFLQGCSEDDAPAANEDCKNVINYVELKDAKVEDTTCSGCIAGQDGIDDVKDAADDDTDIKLWAKALALVAGSTDAAVIAAPIDALNACGAIRVATSCKDVGAMTGVNDPTDLLTLIATESAAYPNCPLCVAIDLEEKPTCANVKKGLEDCGYTKAQLDKIDCEADYSCSTVKTYSTIFDATAEVDGCEVCLNGESTGTYAEAKTEAASTPTDAAFLALAADWVTCGAVPVAASCTAAFDADDVTLDAALLTITELARSEAEFNCATCLAVQQSSITSCADVKVAIQACDGDTDLSAAVSCDACATFVFGSTCDACMTAAAGAAWSVPASTASADDDAAFADMWSPMTYCGAEFDAVTTFDVCNLVDISTAADAAAAGVIIDNQADSCSYCVFSFIAQEKAGDRSCANYNLALAACSIEGDSTAAVPLDCTA